MYIHYNSTPFLGTKNISPLEREMAANLYYPSPLYLDLCAKF